MTKGIDIAGVLARIPDWQAATWMPLDGGLSNVTFRLDLEGRSAVLKLDEDPRSSILPAREVEAVIQRRAHEAGFAAAVLYVDENCYLTDYICGDVWTSESFADRTNLQTLAGVLQKLHALPASGHVFDAPAAARQYAASVENKNSEMLARCLNIIDSVRCQPQSTDSAQLRFCHNDLVAANIVSAPTIQLLDWEYAGDNDPLFDLATIVEHHELSERQVDTLLQSYDGDRSVRRRERFDTQRLNYLALLWLWMCTRNDIVPAGIDRVAARILTRSS